MTRGRYPSRRNRGKLPDKLGDWVDWPDLGAPEGSTPAPFPPASFPVVSPVRFPVSPRAPPRLPGSPWSPPRPDSPWSPPHGLPWFPLSSGSPWPLPSMPGFNLSPSCLAGQLESVHERDIDSDDECSEVIGSDNVYSTPDGPGISDGRTIRRPSNRSVSLLLNQVG